MRLLSVIAAMLIVSTLQAGPEAATPSGQVHWERTLGEDSLWYRLESVSASDYDDILVAAIADEPTPQKATSNYIWLWRLSTDGELLCSAEVRTPDEVVLARGQGDPVPSENLLVTLLNDGTALCVVAYGEGRPWVLRVDAAGALLSSAPLLAPDRSAVMTCLVQSGGQQYLLLGWENLKGKTRSLAIEIDGEGRIIYETSDDGNPPLNRYLDGVRMGERLYLVGLGQDSTGANLPWLVACANATTQSKRRPFPGRNASIDLLRGCLILTQDSALGNAQGQSILIRSITPELGDAWTIPVFQAGPDAEPYDAEARTAHCVVGDKDSHLFVGCFDEKGSSVGRFNEGKTVIVENRAIALLPSGNVFVASTVFQSTQLGYRGKVRCVSVQMRQDNETPFNEK